SKFYVVYEQPCDYLAHLFTSLANTPADVYARGLTATGALDGVPIGIANLAGAETAPTAVGGAGRGFVAWRARTQGEAVHALAPDAGGPSQPVLVALDASTREAPSVGFSSAGGGVLVVSWVESNPPSVAARRFDSTLAPVGELFQVAPSATHRYT